MTERDEHLQCCFDAYCKRLLKNETIDAVRERQRRSQWETDFSELTEAERNALLCVDQYFPERRTFSVLGMDVEIADGDLVRALAGLSADRRDIVLLAYLLGLPDSKIAQRMGMSSSAVQRRRTSTLEQLRKKLEE